MDDLVRFCDGNEASYGDGEMAREFFSCDRIDSFDRGGNIVFITERMESRPDEHDMCGHLRGGGGGNGGERRLLKLLSSMMESMLISDG